MIRFDCEQCGKNLKANPEQAGARYQCSRCGTVGKVPRWADEVAGDAERAGRVAAAAWSVGGDDDAGEPPISFGDRDREEQDMDMTPMVDVTFLLLIFFMITAAFSLQKSIEVPKPDRSDEVAQERTLEEIEDDNDYIVVHVDQDSVVWVEDREAPTRQELLARLREEMEAGPTKLMISVHPEATAAPMVMCVDVGMALGIERPELSFSEREF